MQTLPIFNFFSLFSKPVLFVVFLLSVVVYFIASSVLFYHWKAYGMHRFGVKVAEILYLSVSALLFLSVILSLNYF